MAYLEFTIGSNRLYVNDTQIAALQEVLVSEVVEGVTTETSTSNLILVSGSVIKTEMTYNAAKEIIDGTPP